MEVSVKDDPINNLKKAPNLVFRHVKPKTAMYEKEESQTCFNMKERKCWVENVWQMQKYNFFLTPQGWIFMISRYNSECSLFDFFNKKSVVLPSINVEGSLKHDQCKCVITKDKGKYVVMFVNLTRQRIYFLEDIRRSSNKKWIEYSYGDEEQEKHLLMVVTCNGKFYGASNTNILMIDYKPKPKITTMEMEVQNISRELGSACSLTYMLEADGDLYCVCKHLGGHISRNVHAIVVWKRDACLKTWNKVDSIGDYVFFLNSGSIAAAWPASKIGSKGSLIYFIEEEDRLLYCYDIEAEEITVDVPCPRIRSQFCKPIWIFPIL